LKSEKNVKYVFSSTHYTLTRKTILCRLFPQSSLWTTLYVALS